MTGQGGTPSISVSFQYTEAEYVRAVRRMYFYGKTLRKIDLPIFGLAAAFAVYYLIAYGVTVIGIVLSTVIALVLVMQAMLYYYVPVRNFRSTAKFQEAYALTFKPDGIDFRTGDIDSRLQWSIYKEAWADADYYFLLQNKHQYTILPQRAFEDAAAIAGFEAMVAAQIGKLLRKG